MSTKQFITLASSLALVAACASEPAPKMVAAKNDGVPANSASEARIADGTANSAKSAQTVPDDPSQPLTTPVGGAGAAGDGTSPAPAGTSKTASAGGKGTGKGGKGTKDTSGGTSGGGKVSKAECKQLFDKYIDLSIGGDSRFDGIPPEMIAQLKAQALQQAQSEKGDPCSTQDVSRSQYDCAMGASSTGGWQGCMKKQ